LAWADDEKVPLHEKSQERSFQRITGPGPLAMGLPGATALSSRARTVRGPAGSQRRCLTQREIRMRRRIGLEITDFEFVKYGGIRTFSHSLMHSLPTPLNNLPKKVR